MSAEIEVTPVHPEVPRLHLTAEHLDERQHEPAHTGVDVAVGPDRRRQGGDGGNVVLHTLRVLRCRPDHQHGVRAAHGCHRVDVGRPIGPHRCLADGEAEVVGRLVERGVRRLGEHDLGFGDAPLDPATLPRGEHATQDRLGATAREEAGDLGIAMEQTGRPPDHVGLDLAQRRERLGVQRVLVQVQPGGLLGDLVHRGPAVVHHAEGPTVGPLDVVDALAGQVADHLVDRPTLLLQWCHRHSVAHRWP